MGIDLTGIVISVIGGDRRSLILMQELVSLGARVKAVGFLACEELKQVELVTDLGTAVSGAQVLILPMQGTDLDGNVKTLDNNVLPRLTRTIANAIPSGTVFIIGAAREFLHRWATAYGWKLLEISRNG